MLKLVCLDCQGSGVYIDQERCSLCQGKGVTMSDVKAVHIHLQIEVPEQLDLSGFTRHIYDQAKLYSEHLEVLQIGVKSIYKDNPFK